MNHYFVCIHINNGRYKDEVVYIKLASPEEMDTEKGFDAIVHKLQHETFPGRAITIVNWKKFQ